MHSCRSLAHNEQTGCSPGHLAFFRLNHVSLEVDDEGHFMRPLPARFTGLSNPFSWPFGICCVDVIHYDRDIVLIFIQRVNGCRWWLRLEIWAESGNLYCKPDGSRSVILRIWRSETHEW